ncbi:terminase [Mycobacterium hackensackense]|uniref:terminase n=1 Tax=Mycobacterium hackensackense TaxID=228909 RepID=UPI0022658B1D|nr:terminase [Mycobacterium hackensackense]MCV7255329.1 terminase [Mycobacterium hackensackense]
MPTATAERPQLRGSETPRIHTKPLQPLVAGDEYGIGRTTNGYAAIAFAELILGLRLFPWQKWLLIHALELTAPVGPDGIFSYRFRFIVVLVGRQNGKTLVMTVLALWHLYDQDSPMVIGTAQDLARSEAAWGEAVEMAQDDEELADLIEKIDQGHPKFMRLAKTEETPWFREYRVASATRRGGRGFSGDLILLDELREHQSWDAWSAVTNAMNARPRGQAWAFSNAGDALSVVLRFLRAQAHRALGWPDGDDDAEVLDALDAEMEEYLSELGDDDEVLGFFEWSAAPTAKRTDPNAWAQANPSMNHTDIVPECVTDRAIAAALRANPPVQFEIEVLCRWVAMADAGPFPDGAWSDSLANDQRPSEDSLLMVSVAVNMSRSRAFIARGGFTEDGDVVAGIKADRAGVDWVVPWLVENRDTFSAVVIQSSGAPATSLIDAIEGATLPDGKSADLRVIPWGGADEHVGCSDVFDLLDRDEDNPEKRKLHHLAHPGLDAAATSAHVKFLSKGAWVLDPIRSPTDVYPLQALIGLTWGLLHEQPQETEVWGFMS